MYPKIFLTKFQNSFVLLKGKILVSFLWAFLEYLLHLKFSVNKIFSIHFFFAIFYLMLIFIKEEKDLQISKNVKKKKELVFFSFPKKFYKKIWFLFFQLFSNCLNFGPVLFPKGEKQGVPKKLERGEMLIFVEKWKIDFLSNEKCQFFPNLDFSISLSKIFCYLWFFKHYFLRI